MTVSSSLKKLSTLGLIKRVEHETDTRAKTVSLTSKGKKLIQKLVPLVEAVDAQFFKVLEDKDEKALTRILNKLTHE
jgi:DNA-binding MarR family transcriptional regulator